MSDEYTKQAADFLKTYGIKFSATWDDNQTCPIWDDEKHIHGDKYRITLSRKNGLQSKRVWFDFWNSKVDSQEGKQPEPYSVLSCISSDVSTPDTFEDFCQEFGYETDSRKAEKTFKACRKLADKLHGFFTTAELEALQEIR